jgi:glycosyltransferase involved in cell wall biosynthesis
MRIAVVVSTFPPYKGGMGNVARFHADALRAAGHDVTVFAPDLGARPLFRIGNAACIPQLWWKLRGFEAVELHYPFFGGAEWVWLWKKTFGRRTKLVVMYHMDTVGRGAIGLVFRLYRAVFLKRVLAAADAIVTASRDYLGSSQAAAFAVDPRVVEIPLAADAAKFHPAVARDPNRALFVGGLDRAHYFKGVDILLEAFARAAADVAEARLTIIGDGDLRPKYEARAKLLGVEDRVEFAGALDDASLADRYRSAAFLVLPSIDRSEAFGLVTVEAALSGTPAVVSDLPGVRGVIEDGRTGLLTEPGNAAALSEAMRALFLDPALAAEMGRAARARALERYASEAVSAKLLAVFTPRPSAIP